MKKIFVLVVLAIGIASTKVSAQEQQRDPAVQAQRMKERIKPQLIEKVKLTDAEAEKVIDINLDIRAQMRAFRDLSEDDRKKKATELNIDRDKRYQAIPLSDGQVKQVNNFFDEMRQQIRQNRPDGGAGGRR